MSETPEESKQARIDSEAEIAKEYILSNGAELNQFFMDNLGSVEEIANLIVMHWQYPHKMGALIKQQLNQDLDTECGDRARERLLG